MKELRRNMRFVGMIVVAASSSKATSVMSRTDPIANPISAGVQET